MPPHSTVFVQQPDYVGLRKTPLPVQALGAVYDGRDPYATALGIIVLVLEKNYAREIFVPCGRLDNGKTIYTHDLSKARYVTRRNSFEEAQLHTGDEPISEEAKNLLRTFFEAQNTPEINVKFFVQVSG